MPRASPRGSVVAGRNGSLSGGAQFPPAYEPVAVPNMEGRGSGGLGGRVDASAGMDGPVGGLSLKTKMLQKKKDGYAELQEEKNAEEEDYD